MVTAGVVISALILVTLISGAATTVIVYRRAAANLRAMIEPAAEGELSPLAQITHAMAQDFARTLFLQLKQQLSAPATHIQRQENEIQAEMTGAAIQEQAPGWGALLGLLPKNVQKRVLGNPAAAMALVGMLGRMGGGAGGGAGGNGAAGQKSSVQLRLQNMR